MRTLLSFLLTLFLCLPLLLTLFLSYFATATVVFVQHGNEHALSPGVSESPSKSSLGATETALSSEKQKNGSRFFHEYPSMVTTYDDGGFLAMSLPIKRKLRVQRNKSGGMEKSPHFLASFRASTTIRYQKRSTTTVFQYSFPKVFMDNSKSPSEHVLRTHEEQNSKHLRSHRSRRNAMVEHDHENRRSSHSHRTSTESPTTPFEVESSGMPTSLGLNNYTSASSTSKQLSTFPSPVCTVGYFACVNPSLCVPQKAICNGKPDCPDGSDEFRCVNPHEKTFWDSFFQKRPAAEIDGDEAPDDDSCFYQIPSLPKNVTGSRNGKATTGQELFHELLARDDCICLQEKIVCHNVHLPNLYGFPENIKFLDLGGSFIDQLEFPRERFYQLETLVLSTCELHELNTTTFSTLPSLRVLHLTGNELKRIPPSMFASNRNLTKLYLAHNHLTLDSRSFQGLDALEYLDLRSNRVTGEELNLFGSLSQLCTLHLSYNHIRHITAEFFVGLSKLEILSLTKNKISAIDPGSFNHSPNLKQLYLSHNHLSKLENGMFCHLQNLRNLNLNNNGITRIEPEAFHCLDNLQSLNLENNPFREFKGSGEEEEQDPRKLFTSLANLDHVYFDEWWMCWWAPHVRYCEPKGDGISSVENLLDNVILRVSVWVVGLVGVLGNVFVLVSRLMIHEKNKEHSFYIKNLAFADLLMGLFLISIAYHDMSFRGHFIVYQHTWRHSLTCQLSGMLGTLSSESSVFILFHITLDRYKSIVRPFVERSSSLLSATLICLLLWLLCFLFSCAPFFPFLQPYFGGTFYSSNGLCLPLHIDNPYETGWEYSFFLFIVVNSVAFTFMCYAYWKMLRIIQTSTTSIRSTQQKQDGLLVMRFGLVVLTDFMCWAPIITIKIVAMCGVQIPADLNAWLAVFILPVNSALNPILYTLSTKLFKQQVSAFTIGFCSRFGLSRNASASSSIFQARISRSKQPLSSINGFMMLSLPRNTGLVVENAEFERERRDREENRSLSFCGVTKKSLSNKKCSNELSKSPREPTTETFFVNVTNINGRQTQPNETAIESS